MRETLKNARKEKGLTQQAVADHLGIGLRYYQKIEAGERTGGRIWGERTFEYRENYKRFVEKTDCCVDYVLYLTRQEIEEKQEKGRLFREIEQQFRYGLQRDISLEQLRAIHGILERGNAGK